MDSHTGLGSHTGRKPVDWIVGQRPAGYDSDSGTDLDLYSEDNCGISCFGFFRTVDAKHHGRIYQQPVYRHTRTYFIPVGAFL